MTINLLLAETRSKLSDHSQHSPEEAPVAGLHSKPAPSIDDNMPFGGGIHTSNTITQEMSRKNIASLRNNVDRVEECSDEKDCAI